LFVVIIVIYISLTVSIDVNNSNNIVFIFYSAFQEPKVASKNNTNSWQTRRQAIYFL